MNALTKAARRSIHMDTIENYAIAAICGTILGIMLGLAV